MSNPVPVGPVIGPIVALGKLVSSDSDVVVIITFFIMLFIIAAGGLRHAVRTFSR